MILAIRESWHFYQLFDAAKLLSKLWSSKAWRCHRSAILRISTHKLASVYKSNPPDVKRQDSIGAAPRDQA
jgi:hypothetical protein